MMNAVTEIERGAGDNAPPPHESFAMHINDLFTEAAGFLDGEPIANEGQAEAVSRLLDLARTAKKDADEQRKREKAPHDAAAAGVQELWRPILARAERVADTCKAVLAAWLAKKEIEMRAVAEAARLDAEQKAATARSLHDSAGTDLAARETAEQALKDASKAATAAAKADRAKPQVAGGSRATGLRTSYRAEIADLTEFARWAWKHRPEDMRTFLEELASREVRASQAPIPGIIIHTERTAA